MPRLSARFARLMQVCRRRGRSQEEAEDLIQEAFLRLHEYCRKTEVRDEEGFLTRTVSNLAINEYREFLSFYPTNDRADYAQFKLAMAHYYQMRKPERDQSETREAISALQTFVDRFPRSPLADEGRQRLREAKDRLDDSDYRVGLFYFRAKWYPGAVDRLKALLDRDPQYTRRDAVYYYLAESYVAVKKEAEALPLYERLVKEFEQSEFLAPSKKRIDELKASLAKS